MIDLKNLDDLARKLSDLVPPGLKDARTDLEQNFKSTLQAGLGKLDLVHARRVRSAARGAAAHAREARRARARAHRARGALATPGASKN